jgi:DNA-directed RNA polymerase specialized sigma subunit
MERDLISEYDCIHPNGYNGTSGGEIGKEPSAEIRQRLSEINTERMNNPELREHLRQRAKEQMSDPNMRLLLSKLKQDVYNGDKNPMYGKYHTEETKQRISEKAKERLKNPQNSGMYGRGRRVIQLTFNNEYVEKYISADEAERITGIDRSSIRKCCHHTANSAGGFIWLFEEEYYEQNIKQND